uniref:U3 small nucleolar ribonucleoprotein protein MPP10 n=1 Tax=Plectus sambesii TaxID=2011161 RepID=A0A914XEY5_9BILA
MRTRSSSKVVEHSLPAIDDLDSFVRQVVLHSEKTSGSSSESLRRLYEWLKGVERRSTSGTDPSLAELLIDGFDQEQIWQQVDVHNKFKLRSLKKCLPLLSETSHAPALASSSGVSAQVESGDEQEEGDDEEGEEDVDRFFEGAEDGEGSMDSEQEEDGDDEEEEEEEKETETFRRSSGRRSKVDDQFFNLEEMEAFLDQEDDKAMREGQGLASNKERLLDLDDGAESGLGANYRYEDFYGKGAQTKSAGKKGKAVSFDEEVEDDDDDEGMPEDEEDIPEGEEEDDEDGEYGDRPVMLGETDESLPKSAFDERQERLRRKIETLEEENLKPKTWQMAGEATADSRDANELLQEHLAFEHATKTVPIITQDTTEKLEALIQQRIKDRAFDDVERKIKPKDTPHKYRNELVLDQEKSKQSLAQVYEQEYIKQTEKTEVEQKNVQHDEIKKMMRNLFTKLDALSNFHYSPKPSSAEMRVINNMRSLVAEEVAPLATSDAALLAPEEVKIHAKGDVKAQEEKSTTDKLRDRRHKKSLAKVKADRKRKREAETGVSSDKMNDLKKLGRVKKTAVAETGKVKSSTFFSQLQNEVQNEVTAKRKKSQLSADDSKKSGSAYKL